MTVCDLKISQQEQKADREVFQAVRRFLASKTLADRADPILVRS